MENFLAEKTEVFNVFYVKKGVNQLEYVFSDSKFRVLRSRDNSSSKLQYTLFLKLGAHYQRVSLKKAGSRKRAGFSEITSS